MPVTAALSRKFYETFGQDVTRELVDWLNAVDETYRADLRELNEINFGRFDAKLEQRVAEIDAKLEQRVGALDAKLEQRVAEVRADLKAGLAEVRSEMARNADDLKTGLLKWMFGFWATTVLGVLGTGVAIISLLLRR